MGQSTHHHANGVLLSSWTHLQTIIHHKVHEGVKSSQNALNVSASIQLHCRMTEEMPQRKPRIFYYHFLFLFTFRFKYI